jgi:putative ABC transport system permease protein
MSVNLDVGRDIRYGLRILRKRPVVAVLAVFVLGLGMGSTIATFSIVDAVLLRTPPYLDHDRIVTLWQADRARPNEREGVSPGAFNAWRARARSFEIVAAIEPFSFDYLEGPEPQSLIGALVTEGFFEAIGTHAMLGRTFQREEFLPNARDAVVLSYGGWQRLFGGDPAIIGRMVILEGRQQNVIGVLPRSFRPRLLGDIRDREIYAPKEIREVERLNFRGRYWNAVGKVAAGVSLDRAQAELVTISEQIAREQPRTMVGMIATVVPLREHLVGASRYPLILLFGAVVLVLLITCANVASLLLARASERQREFAIRLAVGAGRARLIRQLLAESLTLAALACLTGLLIGRWTIQMVTAYGPAVFELHGLAIDGRVVGFAVVVAAATSVLFGLAPAIQCSRPLVQRALRGSAGASAGCQQRRFGSALIVAEVALAVVLLVSTGLLIRSFITLLRVDPGFERSNVVALQVFAYGDRYRSPDQVRLFFDDALQRMKLHPGVDAVGLVTAMPLLPSNINIEGGFHVEGRPAAPLGEQATTFLSLATAGYFRAMRIPLIRGRFLDDTDHERAQPVSLVNDLMAQRHWPGDNPLGSRITVNWQGRPITSEVVGVVAGLRHDGLDRQVRPEVFLPFHQIPYGSMTFVVRSSGDPGSLIPRLKDEVWAIDGTMPFYDVATVDSLVAQSLGTRRFVLALLSGFAVVAFILAGAGIYGVLSFATLQRTREIGVRMAMGARPADIKRLVVSEGMMRVTLGLAIGLTTAAAVTRTLEAFLFGITPLDPLTLVITAVLLCAVALAACYLPARRATRVDPLMALRTE